MTWAYAKRLHESKLNAIVNVFLRIMSEKDTEQTTSHHNIENGYEWAQLLNKPGNWSVLLQLCLYFYILTTVLNFSAKSIYD